MADSKEDRGVYRSIHTVMLDSMEFRSLSKNARDMIIYLKIHRYNNMAGIFIFGDGEQYEFSQLLKISIEEIKNTLKELEDTHWIAIRYPILWIRNHLKFEPGITLDNKKHAAGVLNIIKSLPKSEICVNFCDYYGLAYPYNTHSKGYRKPIESHSIAIRNKDTDTDTETEKDTDTDGVRKPLKKPPASIKNKYEIEIRKLEELIQLSEFVHATKDCNFKKWLADHIEKYGIKKVRLGIESIIEHQQDPNHSWPVPPEPARCRRKISEWIGRQYEQSPEEFKKQKDDESLKKFLEEHPE